ncbi:type II toxin-antitoxin system Phd/YefM family antitoxin [Deinococcus geothermalis]|uniref:type II toxin-antitoxin system Phd/YefM family antitoxin n=1 Tax=Deinococcus geothermalis TaxID=68909 RepID=UPI0023555E5E|nr:type II toxin-antitoxin system Phd/YefM family antitoxin [Deinococcus geothermalis]
MTRYWKVEEAKANFSRLLRAAEKEPQVITRHGKPVATVIPGAQEAPKPPRSVWELLRGDFTFTPPEGEDWDSDWLERDRTPLAEPLDLGDGENTEPRV